MAEEESGQDKTEEATPERREEFRERGQIAVSREVSSVFVMAAVTGLLGLYLVRLLESLQHFLSARFQHLNVAIMNETAVFRYFADVAIECLFMVAPLFMALTVAALFITFSQTRLNWSWKKLSPDFKKMNPLSGIAKMFSWDALIELVKSIGKLVVIGSVTFLSLKSEWRKLPGLMNMPFIDGWRHWAEISWHLIWSVLGMMLFIAAGDFLYNFLSLEKKLKMTKQEVKEEYKNRESDPHVKAKMKRMQREIAMSKAVSATKTATVVITNPTHFAVALRYELGMAAPIVVAKGQDYVALRMKEVAKESNVPIIENKPLARTLYKICKEGQEIPESLYRAVSEVIRYVFLLKGRKITRNS